MPGDGPVNTAPAAKGYSVPEQRSPLGTVRTHTRAYLRRLAASGTGQRIASRVRRVDRIGLPRRGFPRRGAIALVRREAAYHAGQPR